MHPTNHWNHRKNERRIDHESDPESSDTATEWLSLAMKAADMGAWIWDLTGPNISIIRTSLYNKILGLESEQPFTPADLRSRIHRDDVDSSWQKFEAVISGKAEEYNNEYRVYDENRNIHWINSWGKSIRDSSGRIVRLTGVMQDITAAKKVEQDRDQFIATLSHDLRSPLAIAKVHAELMERYDDSPERRARRVEKIKKNLERADRMIQDLLDSARLRSGQKLDLVYEKVNLAEFFSGVWEDFTAHQEGRLKVLIEGDFDGRWPVEGLHRAVENLSANAVKYGAPYSPITVSLSSNQKLNTVTLSVHNEGRPIPIEEQKELFDPFHRTTGASKYGKKGWGLGLTVVRGVAEALNGRVEVQSTAEQGTTFSLIFSRPNPEDPGAIEQ